MLVGGESCYVHPPNRGNLLSSKSTNLNVISSIPRANHNSKRYMHPDVHSSTIYNSQTWKQPRCPSVDEWIRKLWYIYIMEYYSDIKNNAFESVLMRWMKLEPIIQSEVSQKENSNTAY